MKGIILAGGMGTRLSPLTDVTNKHLLPVGRKPMIFYPIEKMVKGGIVDILIVTGPEHMGDFVNLLGSGRNFDCQFTYRVQDEAGGIAQALALGEDFAGQSPILAILGDNIFQMNLRSSVRDYTKSAKGAKILLYQVDDPSRFGVAEIKGDKIVGIEEKPALPKSNYCVTGVYFYDSSVWNVIRKLKPSARGELEITDVNNAYIKKRALSFDILKGWWTDAGTFKSLDLANRLVIDDPVE
ncbi:MAG: sugar phosphate nucleotidyltransferase [Planctomycetes bacterium]|nr:sugar phosphate nucleotidyltransferase [Planctomycetota bacterium]